jgi:transcriptional regulator with XRE-family HTH domain
VRQLRQSFGGNGITQAELARALNTTPHTISRWETGIHKPSLPDLESLARFFGIPIERMFPQVDISSQMRVLMNAAAALDETGLQEVIRYAHFQLATRTVKK